VIAADARCAKHPDTPASGICARCGSFICSADTRLVDLVAYCPTCATRPDVDWLEAYRQSKLGRRSSTEWGLLLLMPLQLVYLIGCVLTFIEANRQHGVLIGLIVLLLASAANGVLWFAGVRAARKLHLALGAGWLVALLGSLGPEMGLMVLLPAVLVALFAGAPLTSVPSKLFFQLPVERPALLKSYHSIENNALARYGVTFGVVGLVLPVFPFAALACGAIAWRRVDPNGRPPVGKRGQAIFAVVLGALGLVSSSTIWLQAVPFRHF